MEVSVSEAKGLLTDLVRRAEAGETIILTRHGHPVVRLMPVAALPTEAERRSLLNSIRAEARRHSVSGPTAARSQDFLYDDDGLPV